MSFLFENIQFFKVEDEVKKKHALFYQKRREEKKNREFKILVTFFGVRIFWLEGWD